MDTKITVEQATKIAGGEDKLTLSFNYPLRVMVSEAKQGNGEISQKDFLKELENCQGVAASNSARNSMLNAEATRWKYDDGRNTFGDRTDNELISY